MSFLSLALMLGGTLENKKTRDALEDVDLLKEYELIKQKKSTLSAVLRARIVNIVEEAQKHPITKQGANNE